MLRSVAYRKHPRKLQRASGRGGGAEGRVKKLQEMVTTLIRYERIESTLPKCDEARGYTEQLINLAVKNGDKDRHTMEMADYWLTEKDLIHKLFKVLVPRYNHFSNYNYTQMFRLPNKYPGTNNSSPAVLELKGNPWPPVLPNQTTKKNLLTNILLKELYKDMQATGKVSPYRNLNRVVFPNEYEDSTSAGENDDFDSVEQDSSTESGEQLASTESSEQWASNESETNMDSMKSSEQLDINGSELCDEDLPKPDGDDQSKK
ncbi:39S ribosomal protein L17, mitochondrial-like [Pecten maximus]|uniref:39S ribosomal protein L17, mitochondrial-like n=1 Tax=Pecten maximus TaxID=6579 RepID=UPI0014580533|nr:39S ribosomal protein L17, mitochondrial-like [Pecten maximus]